MEGQVTKKGDRGGKEFGQVTPKKTVNNIKSQGFKDKPRINVEHKGTTLTDNETTLKDKKVKELRTNINE